MLLTIILPTFKELERPLTQSVLDSLAGHHVLIVDTPSGDGMEKECERRGLNYLKSDKNNRAGRLNDGIKASDSEWLVFHHPRSLLQPGAIESVLKLNKPLWGAFTHKFDDGHPLLTFTSWWSNHMRGDLRSIYYLDHCLFCHRSLITQDEPFGSMDIFEDTYFSLSLKKKMKGVRLRDFTSTTSALRFRHNGVLKQALLNQKLKLDYYFARNHSKMNKSYEQSLELNQKYDRHE